MKLAIDPLLPFRRSVVVLGVCVAGALAPTATAADFYVDAAHGSDANNGTSSSLAWRTITHALASLGTSSDVLHVLPGVYSTTHGEVFPLQAHGQRLIGDQGAEVTIIDGETNSTSLLWINSYTASAAPCPEVRGLRFTRGTSGVLVRGTWAVVETELSDVVIDQCGIGLDIAVGASFGAARFAVAIHDSTIEGCGTGIGASSSLSGASTLHVEDTAVRGQIGSGIELGAGSSGGGITATLRRVRVQDNGSYGVRCAAAISGIEIDCADGLIAGNGLGGYRAEMAQGSTRIQLTRSTIANNGSPGLYAHSFSVGAHELRFESSIVHGHAVDVDSNSVASALHTLIGVDPAFVDAAQGDFRLRFGSAAIDSGDPATPVATLDLEQRARSIDGDLDTQERADAGCFEFAPLRVTTTGQLLAPVRFEIAGPAGGTVSLKFTRQAMVAPSSTPFGELDLNPLTLGTLLSAPVSPFPPFTFQRPIPNNPLLVGRTFAFQGLVTSGASPSGLAYTNAEQFTVVP